jgi:hypothetical protein
MYSDEHEQIDLMWRNNAWAYFGTNLSSIRQPGPELWPIKIFIFFHHVLAPTGEAPKMGNSYRLVIYASNRSH